MKRPEIHTSKKEGNKSLTIRNIVERLTISVFFTSLKLLQFMPTRIQYPFIVLFHFHKSIFFKKKSLPYINYRVRKINYLFHIYCFHVAITYIKLSANKIVPLFSRTPLSLSWFLARIACGFLRWSRRGIQSKEKCFTWKIQFPAPFGSSGDSQLASFLNTYTAFSHYLSGCARLQWGKWYQRKRWCTFTVTSIWKSSRLNACRTWT